MSSAPPRREELARGGDVAALGRDGGFVRRVVASTASPRRPPRRQAASPGAAFPFTRGCVGRRSGARGRRRRRGSRAAARRLSPPSGALSGSASSSARVRAACASDCWPSSQSAISPDRAGVGQVGGERGEAAAGAGADRLLGHPEQVGQLAVGASLAQDELHGGALVGRQPVERGGAACRHLGLSLVER